MADKVLVASASNGAPNSIEQLYGSPTGGDGTIITAFSAINNTDINATYMAYIYDSSGAAVLPVIPLKIVVRKRYDVGASITNQLIPAGGSLRTESGTANAITFRVSGVEL